MSTTKSVIARLGLILRGGVVDGVLTSDSMIAHLGLCLGLGLCLCLFLSFTSVLGLRLLGLRLLGLHLLGLTLGLWIGLCVVLCFSSIVSFLGLELGFVSVLM